jgi:Protein of unknown function (DUF2924)
MAGINEQLEALALSTPAQLRSEWRRIFKKEAPPHSTDLMLRAISWRLQSRAHGDLSRTTRQRLDKLAGARDRDDRAGAIAQSQLAPGTRLVREWNEQMIEVIVLEDGYLFQDRRFTSLSQIARHVTGTHWSGPRFFGLKKRRQGTRASQHGAR